jgi:hypothetical protein
MDQALLLPPIAFVVFLAIYLGFSALSKQFAAVGRHSYGKEKSYACGQDTDINKIQPDYSEFFPFAFFFTIMHVVVLAIATMPVGSYWLAGLFIAVVALSLRILFRR